MNVFELRRRYRVRNTRIVRQDDEPEFVPCDFPDCAASVRGGTSGRRVATFDLYLCGYPAGHLCDAHAACLEEAWDDARRLRIVQVPAPATVELLAVA